MFFVLKSTYKKALKQLKASHEQTIIEMQNTNNLVKEQLYRKVEQLEGRIVALQEKNQNVFYQENEALEEQLEKNIIDSKEYYYSKRLLDLIEEKLG